VEVVVVVSVDARVGVSGNQAEETFVGGGDREGLVLDPRLGVFEERGAIDDLFDRDVGLRVDPNLDPGVAAVIGEVAVESWPCELDRGASVDES
jgi:hypothetical protein